MEAKLIVTRGNASKREIELKLPMTVGRGREAGLTVAHPTVSRIHCEIYELDGALVVRDNSSTNGTFVGNERIRHRVLRPDEELTVGPLTFRASYKHSGAYPMLEEGDSDDTPTPMKSLVETEPNVPAVREAEEEFDFTADEEENAFAAESVEEAQEEDLGFDFLGEEASSAPTIEREPAEDQWTPDEEDPLAAEAPAEEESAVTPPSSEEDLEFDFRADDEPIVAKKSPEPQPAPAAEAEEEIAFNFDDEDEPKVEIPAAKAKPAEKPQPAPKVEAKAEPKPEKKPEPQVEAVEEETLFMEEVAESKPAVDDDAAFDFLADEPAAAKAESAEEFDFMNDDAAPSEEIDDLAWQPSADDADEPTVMAEDFAASLEETTIEEEAAIEESPPAKPAKETKAKKAEKPAKPAKEKAPKAKRSWWPFGKKKAKPAVEEAEDAAEEEEAAPAPKKAPEKSKKKSSPGFEAIPAEPLSFDTPAPTASNDEQIVIGPMGGEDDSAAGGQEPEELDDFFRQLGMKK